MSPADVRIERPSSSGVTFATRSANERSERTNTLIVAVLSLACTALSIFDLLLLASGH